MNDRFFLDTNIFIYSLDANEPAKQPIAKTLIQNALTSNDGCISSQVVQECLNFYL